MRDTHSTRGHWQGCNLKQSHIYHTWTFPKSFIWLSNESAINFPLWRPHLENKRASRFKEESRGEERGWQQFSNSLRLRKSPWSLKDTHRQWIYWQARVRGNKEMYTVRQTAGCSATVTTVTCFCKPQICERLSLWHFYIMCRTTFRSYVSELTLISEVEPHDKHRVQALSQHF